MIYSVFSIYDSKAEAYLPPFILPKAAQAKRAFSDCVNSESHQFGQNPQDYTLFELGTFNDENAQYLLQRTPQSLGVGVEYRSIDHPISPELRANGNAQADSSIESLSDEPPIQPTSISVNSKE